MKTDQGQVELTGDPHDKGPNRKKQQRAVGAGSEKKDVNDCKTPKENKSSDLRKQQAFTEDIREWERRRNTRLKSALDHRDRLDLANRLRRSKSISQEEAKQILQAITPEPRQLRGHKRNAKHD